MSTEFAKAFMDFRETLDNLNNTYKEIDVVKIMRRTMEKNVKIDGVCVVSKLKDCESSNPRKGIPKKILDFVSRMQTEHEHLVKWKPVDRAKKPHSWFVCYVYNIVPDETEDGWELCQCSHICVNGKCVTAEHLCWESASENQSRGNRFCRKKCTHDDCDTINVCHCQEFHDPPCI